ncbi:CRISPR-associated ring nuclease [Bacillus cereus group sp. BY142LC]|uniref:CRISPR-associated ring nuclease n=1 Tax=Bacillus cereus group sp. BY142LC TaxID=3018083 RepID=UPI0022E10486|nr:CRISPR-associated ring nuclease [Bacillus cereus group sp. BY142LC]MDA1835051.1 CRISPR-associated ring nuclease [Bacillus cereus group sp. BY142LC]
MANIEVIKQDNETLLEALDLVIRQVQKEYEVTMQLQAQASDVVVFKKEEGAQGQNWSDLSSFSDKITRLRTTLEVLETLKQQAMSSFELMNAEPTEGILIEV